MSVHLECLGRVFRRQFESSLRVDELLSRLGHDYQISRRRMDDAVIKVVGEDGFLLDNHRIGDYEYIRERVAMGKVGVAASVLN